MIPVILARLFDSYIIVHFQFKKIIKMILKSTPIKFKSLKKQLFLIINTIKR